MRDPGIIIQQQSMQSSKSDTSSVTSKESNENVNALNQISTNLFHSEHLDRQLERPHITGIAFSGTIGIGLFVTSGEIIGLSGSLGCVISFIGAGLVVVGVMRSLAELVSVRPLQGALIDYPHTFVDHGLGFAVGITYWLAQSLSMATLTAAAARVAGNFSPHNPLTRKQEAGIIMGLLIITLLSNACGVRMYGNIERICKWIKLVVIASLCIFMILINVGVGGYPTEHKSHNYTSNAFVPSFNPDGFLNTSYTHKQQAAFGVAGSTGTFLSIWTCVTLAVFACMGGDIVIVSAGEAKSPRKDLPAAARFMYLAPLSLYVLGTFLVGFNINYADPALYHPFVTPKGTATPSHSPFIIALQRSSIAPKVLPQIFNAAFLFSAYTAANTALFVSSRTLFSICRKYGPPFLRNSVGKTNNGHTPLAAIMICSLFGLLALLGLADSTFNQPILSLSAFFTGTIGCVYASECVAYMRFKKGLKRLGDEGILSRNEKIYKKKHYRAHGQPIWAWIGLIGSSLIVIFTGWPPLYILSSRRKVREDDLKPDDDLAWDLVGAYVGPLMFFCLYGGYKIYHRHSHKGRMRTYEQFKEAYILPDFDRAEPTMVEDFAETKVQIGHNPSGNFTIRDWKFWLGETWSFIK